MRGALFLARERVAGRERADFTRQLAAFFDGELAVADLAGDLAVRMDDELLADGELALEAAVDLGDVDARSALEHALLGDLDHAAVHGRLDAAFHDERVAIGDLDTLQLDVGPDDELAALALGGTGRRGGRMRALRRGGRELTGGGGRRAGCVGFWILAQQILFLE